MRAKSGYIFLGRVCLGGEGGEHEGNVFIGVGSVISKPVCQGGWDANDGIVVCRELGYAGIVKVTPLCLLFKWTNP